MMDQDQDDLFLSSETEAFVQDLGDRALPAGQPFDPVVVAEILEGRFEFLVDELERDLESRSELGSLRLRVRAQVIPRGESEFYRAPVLNYDRLATGGGLIKRAVTFNMSPGQAAELQRRFDATAEFASFVGEARDPNSDLRQSISRIESGLGEDLASLREALQEFVGGKWSEDKLEEIATFLEQVGVAPERVAEVRAAKLVIEDTRAAIAGLLAVPTLLEGHSVTQPAQVVELFTSAQDAIGNAENAIRDIGTNLDTVITGLAAIAEGLDEASRNQESRAEARESLLAQGPNTLGALNELQSFLEQGYPRVWASIKAGVTAVINGRTELRLASELDLPPLDPNVLSRGLDQIVDADVLVGDTPADRGDQVVVFVELVRAAEGGEEEAVLWSRRKLQVVRRGLSDTVDAHLIFANRSSEPGGDVSETNFEASPSASWTLHDRMLEDRPDAESWASAWNTIDPGLGINVAALSFEDSVEVGAGAHVSFFGDLVQAGYGWNLNVDDDRGYWSLGIGLVELLDIAGLGNIGGDLGD